MPAKLQVVAEPFKIETTVPLPTDGRNTRGQTNEAVRALSTAAIGASVFVPSDKPYTFQQAAWRLGGKGWITTRKIEGGFRVWKVAEPKLRA